MERNDRKIQDVRKDQHDGKVNLFLGDQQCVGLNANLCDVTIPLTSQCGEKTGYCEEKCPHNMEHYRELNGCNTWDADGVT